MNATVVARVLAELGRLGVREFCVAAGARNAPLVSALLSCAGVRLLNFFDERSAAFFALGRMMADRAPVAVVTTSGTAVAELLPAAMEAFYQGVPLVLVTADRPKRFRGSGAPQAVEQAGILGCYAPLALDLDERNIETTAWPARLGAAPVHVNVCLEEGPPVPLGGTAFEPACSTDGSYAALDGGQSPDIAGLRSDDSSVIVTGALHPDDALRLKPLLLRLGLPVVDEAASNLRAIPALRGLILPGGEKTLRSLDARRVIRLGGVPSWRWWRDLETRPEIRVANFCRAPFPGLARRENVTTAPLETVFVRAGDDSSREAATPFPVGASARAAAYQSSLESILAAHPLSEPAWIRRVSALIPPGSRVMLGNSLPVREWNLVAGAPGAGVSFHANRGANGIDGIVSTFLGLAAAAAESWLVIGDLSALYDLSAPWIIPQLPPGRRRVVVINNGGGKIFSRVPSLRALPGRDLEFIENRHSTGFEPWARLWGMEHVRWSAAYDAREAVASEAAIIEIIPDAEDTRAFWSAWDALP